MKRWPDSEWTPGNYDAVHSEGSNVDIQWDYKEGRIVTTLPVETASLYAIWFYYGDAWVEYSFLVNPSASQDEESLEEI